MIYILSFWVSFLLSTLISPLAIKLGNKFKILDLPSERKIHSKPVPRTGGIVFFVVFWILIALFLISKTLIVDSKLLLYFFISSLIIFLLGLIDDKKTLSPYLRLFGQIIASLILIKGGLKIEVVQIPFLGFFHLSLPLQIIGTILWVILLINIVNWLDGLNGLASGMGVITFLAIIYTALLPWVNAFPAVFLSAIMIGALLGFFPFNFFKGSIFMGDSGSNFLGFMIAVVSILGGSKLATSFLVLGFPILDGLWVIFKRIQNRKNIFIADKNHFHHRLLRLGLAPKQIVVFFWLIALTFGLVVFSASNKTKFFGLMILVFICLIFFALLDIIEGKKCRNLKE